MSRTIRDRRSARRFPRLEALEARSLLSLGGAVDPSFGTLGQVTVPVLPPGVPSPNYNAGTTLSAVEPNGTIVLASAYSVSSGQGFVTVSELLGDGTPNFAFGEGSRATYPASTSSVVPSTTAIAVRPDGTIDVAGLFTDASSNPALGVIQLTPTGSLDTSFGHQGIALLPITFTAQNLFQSSVSAMTLDPAGNLIVAGLNDLHEPYVTRLTPSGTVDTTFGTAGVASFLDTIPTTISSGSTEIPVSIAVQASGRIIVASSLAGVISEGSGRPNATENYGEGVVTALTTSGQLDTTFGSLSNGEQILPPVTGDMIRSIAGMTIQPSGEIVLIGTNSPFPTGTSTGYLTLLTDTGIPAQIIVSNSSTVFPSHFFPTGVASEPNGDLLVNGKVSTTTFVGSSSSTVSTNGLARFNSLGILDPNFGDPATPGLETYPTNLNATDNAVPLIDSNGRVTLTYVSSTLSPTGYADSNFLVTRILTTPTPALDQPPADYDGSGLTNLAVYLPASGEFAYRPTNGSTDVLVPFGIPGVGQTIPAPGDYDGYGQTEIAAYLPSQGIYAYRPSSGGPDVLQSFGIPGPGQSIPVPGDYFGTGVDDVAVYLPSIGAFGIRNPAGGPDQIIPFGSAGMGQSIPAPADYFGTGQTDLAVYLPSIGAFAIRNPAGGPDQIIPFGIAGAGNSIPIPGDYDGSGKTELAVYFPKLGEFAYRPANGGPDVIEAFGSADGSIPVPGDYTGVGHDEIAVYDPNYGDFAYRPASGPDVIVSFGSAGIGASLPLAAPVPSNVPPSNPGTVSAMSILSSSVPGGPMAKASVRALARVASSRPAQGELISTID